MIHSTSLRATGSEMAVQEWIAVVGAKTAYIERGSPWENGYIESFNACLRDELLNGEIFYTLREAQINTMRPPTPRSDTSHQHQKCSCPHSSRWPGYCLT